MEAELGVPTELQILEDSQMESISEPEITLNALSRDLAHVIEQVSPSVVAVNARRHLSSSGVYWRDGIIVTAAHTIRRTDDYGSSSA